MKSQIHEHQKNIIFVSKKMIFSAIALTAFSFAGMADETKNNTLAQGPCEDHAAIAYRNALWQTGSVDYAYAKYEESKINCEDAIKAVKKVFDDIIH